MVLPTIHYTISIVVLIINVIMFLTIKYNDFKHMTEDMKEIKIEIKRNSRRISTLSGKISKIEGKLSK